MVQRRRFMNPAISATLGDRRQHSGLRILASNPCGQAKIKGNYYPICASEGNV